MHLLRYTLLRVALLLAAVGVLYLLGLRSWLLWGTGIVVAALLSYVLLPRQRDEAALALAQTVERRKAEPKRDEDADYEDAVIDSSEVGGADEGGAAGSRPDGDLSGGGSPRPGGDVSSASPTGAGAATAAGNTGEEEEAVGRTGEGEEAEGEVSPGAPGEDQRRDGEGRAS